MGVNYIDSRVKSKLLPFQSTLCHPPVGCFGLGGCLKYCFVWILAVKHIHMPNLALCSPNRGEIPWLPRVGTSPSLISTLLYTAVCLYSFGIMAGDWRFNWTIFLGVAKYLYSYNIFVCRVKCLINGLYHILYSNYPLLFILPTWSKIKVNGFSLSPRCEVIRVTWRLAEDVPAR